MIRIRILHKGLALLLLPLLLQVAVFLTLYNLVLQAEQLAANEAKQIRILGWMQNMDTEFANSWAIIGTSMYGGDAGPPDAPEQYRKRMDRLFAELTPLSAGNLDLEKLISEAKILTNEQYDHLVYARNVHMESHGIQSMIQYMRKLKPSIIRLGHSLSNINEQLAQQREATEHALVADQTNRNKIKTQIFAGAVASLILTVLLLIFFLIGITKRLSILVSNAERIPSGEVLAESVSGTDELAFLDAVLHRVASELKSAGDYRKSLMEMVAHDLRSPLLSTKLVLDRMIGKSGNSLHAEAKADDLQAASSSVGRVIALVEDLLTIDKLEAGKLELRRDLIEIDPLIKEVFSSLAGSAQAREITLQSSGSALAVEADRLRLVQVFDNLVSNAIKFSPSGGTVSVSYKVSPTDVKFSVTDSGAGVSEEQKARLFEKFYQATDTVPGGFGLGLAISKLIVSAHGGSIGIDSRSEGGTEVWFTLPMTVDLTDGEP